MAEARTRHGAAIATASQLGAVAAQIFEVIPDPVILVDAERVVVAANAAAHDIVGERLVGRDLILSLRNPAVIDAVSAAFEGRAADRVEFTIRSPAQQIFEVSAIPLPEDNQVVVLLHDITAERNAERMRADFVANVSHELRSPLSTLIGFIETLSEHAHLDPAERTRFLQIMDGEARRMARLIEDLLSLSRVEADEHMRPVDRVDLDGAIESIIGSLAMRAASRSMTVRVVRESEPIPTVAGDRDELTAVFQNLIDNALSYGREGTEVTVSLRPVERIPDRGMRGLRVEVRDRGEGIAAEHLPRLTERFYRVDTGRSRALGGTGLGLAIVKHIVSHHRGRFTIDSTVGEGSVFAVELPTFDQPHR